MAMAGYIYRILFVILVAVSYNYKTEIWTFISDTMGRGTEPSSSSSERETPTAGQDTSSGQAKTLGQDSKTSQESHNYYNPPFDVDDPPKPTYSKSGTRLITLNELAAHGHSGPVWLAVMGSVFDVDKGAEHYYGPEGGYKFFSGIDGSKAYVTGEFNEEGLIDNVDDLTPLQLGELEDWVKFYEKEYTYVGKLIARYYTKDGSPTKAWYKYQKRLGEKDLIKAEQRAMEKKFPGCNSQWTEVDGGKVYCGNKSGGIHRDWAGYPRRFFAPGTKSWRCACVHEDDLTSPHLKLYPDCDPTSIECKVDKKKIQELRERGE